MLPISTEWTTLAAFWALASKANAFLAVNLPDTPNEKEHSLRVWDQPPAASLEQLSAAADLLGIFRKGCGVCQDVHLAAVGFFLRVCGCSTARNYHCEHRRWPNNSL